MSKAARIITNGSSLFVKPFPSLRVLQSLQNWIGVVKNSFMIFVQPNDLLIGKS